MGRRIWRRLKNEKGQSFVEFTLLLPMALILILGVVDLGKATSYWLDSSHLANDAARYAAVNSCPGCDPTDPYALPTAIKSKAETDQLKTTTTVCIWDLTGDLWQKGDEIYVRVSSPYDFLHFLNLASRTVTGKSNMRLEKTWVTPPDTNPYGVGPDVPCS
jgi:hypothetical protein